MNENVNLTTKSSLHTQHHAFGKIPKRTLVKKNVTSIPKKNPFAWGGGGENSTTRTTKETLPPFEPRQKADFNS